VRRAAFILSALLLWALSSPALADSVAERFERGKLEFEHKNFGNAIQFLRPLLDPSVQLTSEDDIVKAYEMLGLSYFYIGQKDKARGEFTKLLYLRPRHRLDTFLIPPPAVAFFDQIWNDPEMKDKLEKIEKERKAQEQAAAQQNQKPPRTVVHKIYLQRSESRHSRLWAFLPFGLGQFQNDHTTKGILLASAGGAALATNIVCYSLAVALANDNGKYSESDAELARGLRVTQYVSLGVFVATWIYGAIDANIYFEPVVSGPYQKVREEKQELGQLPALVPAVFGDGAGLSFQTRF